MFPSSPGPNSTVSGLPVSATGSPGRIPEVSPRDVIERPSHLVPQALDVRGVEAQDAAVGVVEDRRDLLLDFLPRARDGASHADQLETLNEVVPAHRSNLHLKPPRALGSRRSRAGSLSRGR